jgi:hypothetical protein
MAALRLAPIALRLAIHRFVPLRVCRYAYGREGCNEACDPLI